MWADDIHVERRTKEKKKKVKLYIFMEDVEFVRNVEGV